LTGDLGRPNPDGSLDPPDTGRNGWFTEGIFSIIMGRMNLRQKMRRFSLGVFGKMIMWLWVKTTRLIVVNDGEYRRLRRERRPVVLLVWHGRIFLVPYYFRKKNIMPLVSPSADGEIAAQIMARWGYRILRGSGSHTMVGAWKQMIKELREGGEVIIVPDGPRGPNRIHKLGGLKLAKETGAHCVPFTFSTDRKKILRSWDHFLMFKPFSRVVVIFGDPFTIAADISEEELERERLRAERLLTELDQKADRYFEDESP
jgi:lysophospholipid acyltransferase (LPLAT)-like uncharacterized protein